MRRLIGFDQLVAILTIPISIFLMVIEYRAPRATFVQAVGPHVWPLYILGLLVIMAVALFVQAVRNKKQPSAPADPFPVPRSMAKWYEEPWMAPALLILGLILYAVLLDALGFILSTFLLIIYLARLLEGGHWLRNILTGAVFSVGVYLLFVKVLNTSLPAGLLG
jgi:putative tricarboxylic transport membrane protein